MDDGFVTVQECAHRMRIPVDAVLDLIEQKALRAHRFGGWGEVLVEPAIVGGAATARRKRRG